jgi:hypothetical protein
MRRWQRGVRPSRSGPSLTWQSLSHIMRCRFGRHRMGMCHRQPPLQLSRAIRQGKRRQCSSAQCEVAQVRSACHLNAMLAPSSLTFAPCCSKLQCHLLLQILLFQESRVVRAKQCFCGGAKFRGGPRRPSPEHITYRMSKAFILLLTNPSSSMLPEPCTDWGCLLWMHTAMVHMQSHTRCQSYRRDKHKLPTSWLIKCWNCSCCDISSRFS